MCPLREASPEPLKTLPQDAHWYLRALEEVGLRAATAAALETLDGATAAVADDKGGECSVAATAVGSATVATTAEGSATVGIAAATAMRAAIVGNTDHTAGDAVAEAVAANAADATAERLLKTWGLRFGRVPGYTGVWCFASVAANAKVSGNRRRTLVLQARRGEKAFTSNNSTLPEVDFLKPVKVMATGVAVKRWVTQHGLALNCDCDLAWAAPKDSSDSSSGRHRQIVPCGINDMGVGTVAGAVAAAWQRSGRLGAPPGVSVFDAAPHVLSAFEEVFGCECVSES
jgi:lipoate-protein ligase B